MGTTPCKAPDPPELLAALETAVRSGRPGQIRRTVRALLKNAPSDLFRDPATSERYDVFAQARAAVPTIKQWRSRQACKKILFQAGAYC